MANNDAFLRQKMHGKYTHMDVAINDINQAIYHYKDLRVKCDNFFYNDGTTREMINLCGTIPVSYKNSVYNIPVILWIQEQHPYTAPICFVQPTKTMQVRQGKHVDGNGKLFLDYLHNWNSRSHNLSTLIQNMRAAFGLEPPVFSKQPQSQPTHSPAYRTGFPRMSSLPYPTSNPQGPPTRNYQPAMPMPGSIRPPYPQSSQPANYLPYPTYPTGQPVPNTPYPTPTPIGQRDVALDDNMILASLRSAVNDTLKRRMRDTYTQATTELKSFQKTELDLKNSQQRVFDIEKMLKDEIIQADQNLELLKEKNVTMKDEIDQTQNKQDSLSPDDFVQTTTPVYKQVVNSHAEDQAIEDLIYHLVVATDKNSIELDVMLKHVRSLYREQFMLRRVIDKCRKTARLENAY